MAQFDPTPIELSTIERIETVYNDIEMPREKRTRLLERFWNDLERVHGDTIIMLKSPEGQMIRSPFLPNFKG